VTDKATHSLLKKLLLQRGKSSRLWASLVALTVGTLLLLAAALIWWNFNELLHGRGSNDSLGSTFLTISKRVSKERSGRPETTVFSQAEIADLKRVAGVEDVGMLLSNDFPLAASLGTNSGMDFYTLMFLEAAPDNFLDKKPENWQWQPGNIQVPLILSREFLNLYNYGFALSQGLPQLSEETISQLPFQLIVGAPPRTQTYTGRIVGFSDRITSILVPESFIRYANEQYGSGSNKPPSRLVVKVKDPSATAFNDYLKAHDYATNAEQLRLNKLRSVVNVVAAATGVLALLLMGVSVLVFLLFIELTVARARDSIRLLLEIGYSPKKLIRFLSGQFMPLVAGVLIVALLLACALQIIAAVGMKKSGLELSYVPGWPVWLAFMVSGIVLFWQLRKGLKEAVGKV